MPDADAEMLRQHVNQLGEFFDTVQIFCTRRESFEKSGTSHFALGAGNWFARYGQLRNWILEQNEYTKLKIREDEDSK